MKRKTGDLLGVSKNLSPHVLSSPFREPIQDIMEAVLRVMKMPEWLSVDHLMTASDKPPNAEVMNVPECGCYACVRQLKNTNMNN